MNICVAFQNAKTFDRSFVQVRELRSDRHPKMGHGSFVLESVAAPDGDYVRRG